MTDSPIITSWSWQAGSKRSGFLPVRERVNLPVTVLCGMRPGPSVLISGGVHSSEYVGIQAAIELAAELAPEQITGSVAILPLMNPSGFANRTMSMVYEDGKNLNRVFPGSPDGTMAENIAYEVSRVFLQKADVYIDLHGGDGYEEMCPCVFCQGAAGGPTAKQSRAMAELASVPYLIPSPIATGGAYNYAGTIGVPGILLERGGLGLWSRGEVDLDKRDVKNILRFLGVLDGAIAPQVQHPAELQQVIYVESAFTGCWYPRWNAGDVIPKGEIIGEVRDFFGNTLQTCGACMDGVLLYQAKSLSIIQNGPMAAYGIRA